jgi:histidine triad (HIT) family protein
MADCIFCQIIKGELPCAKVYEDDRVISFLDINPITAGHTLVLPKRHCVTLFEISTQDLHSCTAASQKIGQAVYKATKASGLNFFQNNYRAAGQLVDHIYFHLIPRFHQDSFVKSWPRNPYQQGDLGKMLKKIKAAL